MTSGTITATPHDAKGTWLVTLYGDHDLSTRRQLEEQTGPIWPLCKTAVIDLSQVEFIDSGVIRWLLSVDRELETAGARTLSIVEGAPGSIAARLFSLLRIHKALACYPTTQDAFAQPPTLTKHRDSRIRMLMRNDLLETSSPSSIPACASGSSTP